jgi:hypothetical protein
MNGQGTRCKLAALGAATLIALACAPAAMATDMPDRTLNSATQAITWQGRSADPTGQGYGPPVEQSCTSTTCDTLMLNVQLPPGTFTKGPKSPAPAGMTRIQAGGATDMPGDGVLISIKWATDFDQWNLYVDDMSTGQTIAQGNDLDSNAQSVLLSLPHNGLYRVRIVPFYTNFDAHDLTYQGEAVVYHDQSQRYPSSTPLLPRIQTVAPSNFHIGDIPPIASNPTGWRYTPAGTFSNSCYLDETVQFGSTKCLRFDNDIRNVGAGPLILRFDYSAGAFAGNCQMQQEILSSDGSVSDRGAGPCVFHAQHAHFHYQNMGRYQLYAVDRSGTPGASPIAASNKVGFCTIDVEDFTFGAPATYQHPRTYSFPTCNIPNAYSTQLPSPSLTPPSPYGPNGVPEYMGVSAGWGDVYTWDLPQQYIDISKIPDGTYEVVSRSNPDGGILTSDRSQETGVSCIRINGDKVDVLHELPSQPNSAPLPPCDGKARAATSSSLGTLIAARKQTRAVRHAPHHRRHHRAHRRHRVRRGHARVRVHGGHHR